MAKSTAKTSKVAAKAKASKGKAAAPASNEDELIAALDVLETVLGEKAGAGLRALVEVCLNAITAGQTGVGVLESGDDETGEDDADANVNADDFFQTDDDDNQDADAEQDDQQDDNQDADGDNEDAEQQDDNEDENDADGFFDADEEDEKPAKGKGKGGKAVKEEPAKGKKTAAKEAPAKATGKKTKKVEPLKLTVVGVAKDPSFKDNAETHAESSAKDLRAFLADSYEYKAAKTLDEKALRKIATCADTLYYLVAEESSDVLEASITAMGAEPDAGRSKSEAKRVEALALQYVTVALNRSTFK